MFNTRIHTHTQMHCRFWQTRGRRALRSPWTVSDENGKIGRNESRVRAGLKEWQARRGKTLSKTLIQNHSRTQQQTANHYSGCCCCCCTVVFPAWLNDWQASRERERERERENCSASRCENKVARVLSECFSTVYPEVSWALIPTWGYREASCFTDRIFKTSASANKGTTASVKAASASYAEFCLGQTVRGNGCLSVGKRNDRFFRINTRSRLIHSTFIALFRERAFSGVLNYFQAATTTHCEFTARSSSIITKR